MSTCDITCNKNWQVSWSPEFLIKIPCYQEYEGISSKTTETATLECNLKYITLKHILCPESLIFTKTFKYFDVVVHMP